MACACIKDINADLERLGLNTRLQVGFRFVANADAFICIGTEKVDAKRRGRPVVVAPSYCPMCGVKYRTGRAEDDAIALADPEEPSPVTAPIGMGE